MDFEEPTKSRNCNSIVNTANAVPEVSSDEKRPVQNNEEIVRIEADDELHPQLHLEDAGEGAQPLRLLPCGHVFHVRSQILSYTIDFHIIFFKINRKRALILGLLMCQVVVPHASVRSIQSVRRQQNAVVIDETIVIICIIL